MRRIPALMLRLLLALLAKRDRNCSSGRDRPADLTSLDRPAKLKTYGILRFAQIRIDRYPQRGG
jgi:hypothetical protein